MVLKDKKMLFVLKGIFFALFFLICQLAYVQETQFVEDIKNSMRTEPKLDVRLDIRNSFITTRLARIRGVKLGLDYNSALKLGLSYNWLVSSFKHRISVSDLEVDAELNYQYIAPYVEYAFYRKEPWEVSIPVHFGFGWTNYEYKTLGQTNRVYPGFIFSYEPYMIGRYTLLKYFALGAGVGYRLTLTANDDLNQNFNSPIYVFKFQVLLGKIWSDLNKTID